MRIGREPKRANLCGRSTSEAMDPPPVERRSAMWHYYDRRIAFREPGAKNVLSYFLGLGARADLDTIEEELFTIHRLLRGLPATTYLDIGCGPTGEFTSQLPGSGCAMDQSEAVLRQLGSRLPMLPLLRADAMRLPIADNSIGRVFISHLYGLLLPDESAELLAEVRRVANEMVILDSGRPPGTGPRRMANKVDPRRYELPDLSTPPRCRDAGRRNRWRSSVQWSVLRNGQRSLLAEGMSRIVDVFTHEIGGRRAVQSCAAWRSCASRKSTSSEPRRATNCTPTGSPFSEWCSGRQSAG